MSQSTLFQCSAEKKCPENLCCGKDGFCSSAADACDSKNGCQHNCKEIPDPRQCKDFKSALFPNMQQTKTKPMFAVSRAVPPMKPPAGSSANNCTEPPQVDYPLAPCDLVEAMGGPDVCKYCLYYYDRIREAVEAYDMVALAQPSCDAVERKGSPRLAAFLAQVRHETSALSTMFQKLDNGAGAIHMIPAHFESVAAGIPRLKRAIDQTLPGLEWKSAMTDSALQRIVGLIVSYPEHTFLTAGWWITSGAAKRLNPECGDLRVAADLGRGNGTSDQEATGFFKVSRCIFGSVTNDPGIAQRLEYYDRATKVTELFTPVAANTPLNPPTETPTDDGRGSQPEDPGFFSGPIAFIGSFIGVLVVLMAAFLVFDRVRRRRVAAATGKEGDGHSTDQSSSESRSERAALTPKNDQDDLERGRSSHMSGRWSSTPSMRPRSDSGTVYIIEHLDDDDDDDDHAARQARRTSAASNHSRPGSIHGHMGPGNRSTSPHPKRVSSAASIHSASFQMYMQAAAEQSRRMSMMSVHSGHGAQQLARSSSNQSMVMMHPAIAYTQQLSAQVTRPSTAPVMAASHSGPRASIMSMDSVMGYPVAMLSEQAQPVIPFMVLDPLPAPIPAADPGIPNSFSLYDHAASAPQLAPVQFGYYHQPNQAVSFELGSGNGSSDDPTSADTVSGRAGTRPVSRASGHQ